MKSNFVRQWICLALFLLMGCSSEKKVKPGWPQITRETKPWTRWWWHGNALTKEGITIEIEAYQKAGLGGLEITPIYGVLGYEDKFVNYLSPEWMELFLHTLKEGERLGLGIDMATGTGWPFGGPWVTGEDACKNMHYKIYELKGGEQLKEKIEFIQHPYLRAVGNQIDIKKLIDPIEQNKNLQALAIDQVQFEKPLMLKVLMGYSNKGDIINLTQNVNADGKLMWTVSEGEWKLYALFEGWHGKMVERAGPGGEGNVIDHFSTAALQHYLQKFDSAFLNQDISSLRSFFNDSYEVDDARGAADFSPLLFEEFTKRRGYDLREHLPALFGKDEENKNRRVLCDYRETISEMLLENFTQPWRDWAHSKNALVRNQAHGSPSNILDLYATVDIPEIEGVDPLRIKLASSAGNVTGKRLISSESATWLNEHFESNLSDIKVALDRFMVNGVNHIFYHGTSYSPPGEPWPGWLFYAAVHLNPRNPQWKDFDALNEYVARCQSFLQNSTPDNDVLLYYPIYDRFSTPSPEMVEHFDGIGRQFENTAFERAARYMMENGYAFDYISDKQIGNLILDNAQKKLKGEGGSYYQTLIVPHCEFIPAKTFQNLMELAKAGATIIMAEGLPKDVSGFGNLDNNQKLFHDGLRNLLKAETLDDGVKQVKLGSGQFLISDQLNILLSRAGIRKESLTQSGIDFIRKKEGKGRTLYFISNRAENPFEGWLPLQVEAESAVLYDPMNGQFGKSKFRRSDNGLAEVFVQLTTQQTLFIETYPYKTDLALYNYLEFYSPSTTTPLKIALSGKWTVDFISGGPELPVSSTLDSLKSWTKFGNKANQTFSGTASYKITFNKPSQDATGWLLNLGVVKESAEVFLNGKSIGTLIGRMYQTIIPASQLLEKNVLEIQVTNLMANRIADLDKRKVFWKKFYNVNFPSRKPENRKNGLFDASEWEPRESGLIGPVTLSVLK